MNDRAKILAKRAGFRLQDGEVYTSQLEHLPITKDIEKLTKLILKDIDQIVDQVYHSSSFESNSVLFELDQKIKDHFYAK